MSQAIVNGAEMEMPSLPGHQLAHTAFGYPRNFLGNRFVYVVVSPRAGGLSIGVNMNPDGRCNFECVYCEVNRAAPPRDLQLSVEVMARELLQTLQMAREGRFRELQPYRHLPDELLKVRHVAFSGDGEPTLCPQFAEAVQAVAHVRALGEFPFFKLVLITNATALDSAPVQYGLKFFTRQDEVWAKLDAGSQAYMDRVDRPHVSLQKVLANILALGRQRPVVIQSLFLLLNGAEPPPEEIEHYAQRLKELKESGAQIALVQVHSATRPFLHPECGHLPLKVLSRIAQTVRRVAGLKAEVF
jgi:wyosine [tRNA(Phe)-imidazoG37] synthetase (radical SAM superfamily)